MEPIIEHIQIIVKDMTVAVPFYDKLLPLLGFDLRRRVGGTIVSGPKLHPEYGPNDYAVFFKDPDGVKYEIVCNEPDAA
jgi:catechol 2,3-dioxygenase-like lactoylglutathione lyase family enzyme